MNVRIVPSPLPRPVFEKFSIQIDIDDVDQLREFTRVAGKLCNGHGLQLYDLLKARLDAYERMLPKDHPYYIDGMWSNKEDQKP